MHQNAPLWRIISTREADVRKCPFVAGAVVTASLIQPDRRWGERIFRTFAGVGAAAAGEAADGAERHVVGAEDLAAQSQSFFSEQAAKAEDAFLRFGHLL